MADLTTTQAPEAQTTAGQSSDATASSVFQPMTPPVSRPEIYGLEPGAPQEPWETGEFAAHLTRLIEGQDEAMEKQSDTLHLIMAANGRIVDLIRQTTSHQVGLMNTQKALDVVNKERDRLVKQLWEEEQPDPS